MVCMCSPVFCSDAGYLAVCTVSALGDHRGKQGAAKTNELVVWNGYLLFAGVHPPVFMCLCTGRALHLGHGVVQWFRPRADWSSRNAFGRPWRSSSCFTLALVTGAGIVPGSRPRLSSVLWVILWCNRWLKTVALCDRLMSKLERILKEGVVGNRDYVSELSWKVWGEPLKIVAWPNIGTIQEFGWRVWRKPLKTVG